MYLFCYNSNQNSMCTDHVYFFSLWRTAHFPIELSFSLIGRALYINALSITYAPDVSLVCMHSCFSHVGFFVTPWTVAHLNPLSMGFSQQ